MRNPRIGIGDDTEAARRLHLHLNEERIEVGGGKEKRRSREEKRRGVGGKRPNT